METSQTPKKAVVIYHDNCMDGFASAWAFHTLKEKDYLDGVEYIPASYNQHPPASMNFIDKDVFIVDFSYPREDILYINQSANKTTILDHHKTAQEALSNWDDKPANVEIVFDMSRSGAGITWDYFSQELRNKEIAAGNLMASKDANIRRPLINYVEDRDLWKFLLPNSKDINAVIAVTPKDFTSYSMLSVNFFANPEHIADIGQYLSIQHQQICEQIVRDARPITIFTSLGEHHGLACNCTGQFASEVGNLLSKTGADFGASYFFAKDGSVKWSLRSEGNYDVSRIAKCFGGGGHKNAAGFTIFLNTPEDVDPAVIRLREVP